MENIEEAGNTVERNGHVAEDPQQNDTRRSTRPRKD